MIERYRDARLAGIWNRQAEIDRWFAVEVAWMRQVRGKLAADALASVAPPDAHIVQLKEQETRHEVVAFLRALDERIRWAPAALELSTRVELRQWLHYGLTSSDVTDSGLGMALKATHEYLLTLAAPLIVALARVAISDKGQVLGRTHGQRAVLMSIGHPWKVLYGVLVRCHDRAKYAGSINLGKLSGPVGTGVPEPKELRTLSAERLALRELGLNTVGCSQVVPRDSLVYWAQVWASVATACDQIAIQVWLLAQEGIDEAAEPSVGGQVGSSAMPHKVNPVRSENIRGLARLARGYAQTLQECAIQWGQHDLSHSSIERVVLPDLCHALAAVLSRTTSLLSGLTLERTPNYIVDSHGSTYHELMRRQRAGQPYVEAHTELMALPYQDGILRE